MLPHYSNVVSDSEPANSPEKKPTFRDLLKHPDRPTRMGTWLSLIFAGLSVFALSMLIVLVVQNRGQNQSKTSGTSPASTDHAPPPQDYTKSIHESLGTYHLILLSKSAAEPDTEIHMDLVAECSNDSVCAQIKANTVGVRDLVTPILNSTEGKDWLNPSQKNQLKRRLSEQLSGLVKEGSVLNVHISDLQIERVPSKKP